MVKTRPFGISSNGRITIAKTLGLSKLLFSSACISTPAHVIDKVNGLIVNFVSRGKKPKIKSDTLIGSKDQGKRHFYSEI